MLSPSDPMKQIEKPRPFMEGKTIKKVDASSVNCINIEFEDGSELLLEVEAVNGSIGLYGISAYTRKD